MSRPYPFTSRIQSSVSKVAKDPHHHGDVSMKGGQGNEMSSIRSPKPGSGNNISGRQPFANKNTTNQLREISTEEVEMGMDDVPLKKNSIFSRNSPILKVPSKSISSLEQKSQPISSKLLKPSTGTSTTTPTITHGKHGPSPYASHSPSPLSFSRNHIQDNQHGQSEGQENEPETLSRQKAHGSYHISPTAVKTPRKRAVPLEDVHARNIVGHDRGLYNEYLQSPNPHKRSKSSHNGSSNAGTSTSTSLGISAAVDDVHLRSQGESSTAANGPETTSAHMQSMKENVVSANVSVNRAMAKDKKSVQTSVTKLAKTVRIDKQSRISPSDRLKREETRSLSTMEWRKRFLRAFPSFRFYLDGFDHSTKAEIGNMIVQLGGQLEPFFSNTVTHLVTQRKFSLPTMEEHGDGFEKNAEADPIIGNEKASATSTSYSNRTMMGAGRFSRMPTLRKKNTSVPLHSERNPFDDLGPPVSANDILVKAKNFGIKVWTFDKFKAVMTGLKGDQTVENAKKQPNLSQMLAKEKVYGTQERDPKAARADYHYFSRNSIYVLIEDATGEHRPIMAQEWRKPTREDEEVPWPMLYGHLEGRCPFTRFQVAEGHQSRTRPNRFETLQRSVSLNHVRRQNRNASLSPAPSNDSRSRYTIARGASPYPLASGNSVSIASTNLTSTTSVAPNHNANALGLMSPFHPLGRKAQQSAGIGLGRPSSLPRNFGQSVVQQRQQGQTGSTEHVRTSLVNRMLGIADSRLPNDSLKEKKGNPIARTFAAAGGQMRRSASVGTALQQQREKRPGYCENCRQKYEDFDDHIMGRRHRKFASDDSNFVKIDELLCRVNRPIAAWAVDVSNSGLSGEEGDEEEEDELHEDIEEPFSDVESLPMAADDSIMELNGNIVEDQTVGETMEPIVRDTALDTATTHRSPQALVDVIQSWQRDAAHHRIQRPSNSNIVDDDQDGNDLDELEKHLAEAAAAFRIRTGAKNGIGKLTTVPHDNQYGTSGGEDTTISSPNAPSCGMAIGTGCMDDSMNTTISPHTSPHILPREEIKYQRKEARIGDQMLPNTSNQANI